MLGPNHAFAIVAALALAGCASGGPPSPQTVPVAIAAPPAGKGQIVFFRPSGFIGALVRCTVRENGKMVVRLGNGRYFIVPEAPGTRVFTATTEATDTLAAQVAPNATTYVKCTIRMGILVGRPNLSDSSAEEFERISSGLTPEDPKKVAKEIQADEAARIKVR